MEANFYHCATRLNCATPLYPSRSLEFPLSSYLSFLVVLRGFPASYLPSRLLFPPLLRREVV